jgi:hypothetical protein
VKSDPFVFRKFQENQVGLKVNGTHQLLVHADYVNLMGCNMNSRKKNTEALIDASKEVRLEVNTGKTNYILVSHHQNSSENHSIKTANRYFENVAIFKYFGRKVTD